MHVDMQVAVELDVSYDGLTAENRTTLIASIKPLFCNRIRATGTALSGSISTILTVLSWICVGIHSRRALPSPVCA